MKKSITALVAICLMFLSITAVNAFDYPDEQWMPSGPPTEASSYGMELRAGGNEPANPYSYIMNFKTDGYVMQQSKVLDVKECKSLTSAECAKPGWLNYVALLGMCDSTNTVDCVESISAKKEDGTDLPVTYAGNFPLDNIREYKGNSNLNLPNGKSSFLLDIPGAPHKAGSTYLVNATMFGFKGPSMAKFKPIRFSLAVNAVSIETGNFLPAQQSLENSDYSRLAPGLDVGWKGVSKCAQSSATQCAAKQSLPTDIVFSAKLRLKTKINGWLYGRASNVDAAVSTDSKGIQRVEISGRPVISPSIFGWVEKANAPKSLVSFYNKMSDFDFRKGSGYPNESLLRYFNPEEDYSLSEMALWLPILKDTAAAAPTYWHFMTMEHGFANSCLSSDSKLIGIVNTNASGFKYGPPEFNKKLGTLDYKVLAPHYLPDGSTFQGSYDLWIDASVARCIYGFTSAPITATVSIVTDKSTTIISTSTVKATSKFIKLGAYGFTFSNPTLRVKLTQKKK